MTTFTLTAQFLKCSAALEKDKANKTFKAMLLFYGNPRHPGLNYEKLSGRASAMNSIRVDQAFRIILQPTSAVTIFHFVGGHDDAYRMAETIIPVITARLRGGEAA